MSKTAFDNPMNSGYGSPFIPSWYMYLPFSDTLKMEITTLNDINVDVELKPSNLFLKEGCYKLSIDTILINETYSYRFYIHFCDSTFSRRFMLLK
jgi:hypothetical protein